MTFAPFLRHLRSNPKTVVLKDIATVAIMLILEGAGDGMSFLNTLNLHYGLCSVNRGGSSPCIVHCAYLAGGGRGVARSQSLVVRREA